MSDGFLGWNNPQEFRFAQGMFGTYYNHNGDLNNLNTTITSFPNTAQVALLINSDYVETDVPHADAYSNHYQAALMKRAFENAWPEITISGTSGDDTFELRRNDNDNGSLDIFLNGNLIVRRWVETLDRLTLNGIGGDDQFIIDDVPGGLDLYLNGGADDDTFFIGDGDLDNAITGYVIIDGQSGDDTLVLDDTLDLNFDPHTPLPPGSPDFYYLTDDSVSKIGSRVDYAGLEHVRLNASNQSSVIFVTSTAAGVENVINANDGLDVFRIGGGGFDSNILGDLRVHGGSDLATVMIDDSKDAIGNDKHTFGVATYAKSSSTSVLEYLSVQQIRLDAGSNDDTVEVVSTFELDQLTINTDGGQDTVNVHALSAGTELFINTGGANDTIELTPQGRDLDALAGVIRADMGGGSFDEILIDDHDDTGDDTYNLRRRQFDTDGFGRLHFDNTERVELWANGGDNRINIRQIREDVDLTVRCRGGNDEIVAGRNNDDLDSFLLGDLTVYGGGGQDVLRLNDGSDTGIDTYQFSNSAFTKTPLETWSYFGFEEVVLNAGEGDNTVNVNLGLGATFDLTINAWLGDDTINIGSGRADFMEADVHVNGASGDDRINIHNELAQSATTYTFQRNRFDMSGPFFGSLSYVSIADVVLYAGDATNTYDVNGFPIDTDIEIFGNAGSDTFNIGAGDLDAVGGDVVVHGHLGTDVVNIFDQNDAGDDLYTVTNSSVHKSNFDALYNGMEELNLFANPDDNTILVESTLAITPVTIDAGAGDDVVHLSPALQSLLSVEGTVTVAGADGHDTVFLHDENNPFGDLFPYTIGANSVKGGFLFGGVTFDATEFVQLELGAGDDLVNVLKLNPTVRFLLDGNNGNDSFNVHVQPGVAGDTTAGIFINGGPGADAVAVTGTGQPDEVSVSAGFGTADVNLINIENVEVDLLGGTDVLQYKGVAGTDESVEVHASTTAGNGVLSVVGELDFVFENTEIIDLLADIGDRDTATFIGTDEGDQFEIDLAAARTNDDPVLQLVDPDNGTWLLALRSFRNFGVLEIQGGDGADVFNVRVAPAGPAKGLGHNLAIDGGEPSGPGQGKDELNVFFQTRPPDIDHDHDNQNDSGTFDIAYGLEQFFIEYENIEKALAKSA